LKAEVAELLARAEAADAADVPDGMSIPDELAHREERLAKLAEARAKIEAEERTARLAREEADRAAKAIREAEEEAGILGVLARKPLGRYRHVNGNGTCRVDVYLMRVTDVREHWLEEDVRQRRWMRIREAAACLRKELRQFVHAVEEVVGTD